MRAELTKDGYLKVTAETITEAWALNITHTTENLCHHCNKGDVKLIIDGSILLEEEKGNE